MDLLTLLLIVIVAFVSLVIAFIILSHMVRWAKKMPKSAYLFMALFPLISLFPIPPPVFENVAKAKHEQRKKQKQDDK